MIHNPQNPPTTNSTPLDIFSENIYDEKDSIYYISGNKLYFNRKNNQVYLNTNAPNEDVDAAQTRYPQDEVFGINYDFVNKNYTFYFALNKYIYSQTKG